MMEFKQGQIIGEKYRLDEMIGQVLPFIILGWLHGYVEYLKFPISRYYMEGIFRKD